LSDADSGYSIKHAMFETSRMAEVSRALESSALRRSKAGARHVLSVPAVGLLANDPGLLAFASSFVDAPAMPFRATLFDKSPASNWLVTWHQDTVLPLSRRSDDAAWGPWTVKGGVLHAGAPAETLARIVALRIHLDDSDQSNGPLRVLPGTHAGGVLTHEAIQHLANVIQPADCTAPAGGVVAMRPLVVHASSKSTGDRSRRVLHIEYAASMHVAPGLELAVG
jgi:hypothetical protein